MILMKVAVVGSGYVGLVTGTCFANLGNEVSFIDIDEKKVEMINKGEPPIYEPGLEEMLKGNLSKGRIKATTDYTEGLKNVDVVFICVGTPSNTDGSINLKYVKSAARSIGEALKSIDKYVVITVKSTVVPGTTESLIPILQETSGKKVGTDFGLCMNPEFLREGSAVKDFLNPDKIVIGEYNKKSGDVLEKLYEPWDKKIPRLRVSIKTAEMIKYAQNALLATKISFINEIANICEKIGVNVDDVAHAIGLDSRISPRFLRASRGYGGSCFPKDVKALIAFANSQGYKPKLLEEVNALNERQPYRMIELAKKAIGSLESKKIGILGLAFKPDTDDIREAPSLKIINRLLELKAKVKVYDPKAMKNVKRIFGDKIEYCESKEGCIKDVDTVFIITEWKEFCNEEFLKKVKIPIIDGIGVIRPERANELGLKYYGIGRII